MEKIILISPAAHFCILRNLEIFMEDRLWIHQSFYEIPIRKASGEDRADIISRARSSYRGYSPS